MAKNSKQKKKKKGQSTKRTRVSDIQRPLWRRKYREAEGKLIPQLFEFLTSIPSGDTFLLEAWNEFFNWKKELPEPFEDINFDSIFVPWFLFSWDMSHHVEEGPDFDELQEDDEEFAIPIAIAYLSEFDETVGRTEKRFIFEAIKQPFSIYSVLKVVPGVSMTLRDLLREKEFTVLEKSASREDMKGAVVFARVLDFPEVSILFGVVPQSLPGSCQIEAIAMREELKKEAGVDLLDTCDLHFFDSMLREFFYTRIDEFENYPVPHLRNTDGEEMKPNRIFYRLSCSPNDAFKALSSLSLAENPDDLLDNAKVDKKGALLRVSFHWLKTGNSVDQPMGDTVLGNIEINKARLIVETNSLERSERMKEIIEERLGNEAHYQTQEISSLQKMLEESHSTASNSEAIDLTNSPEVRAELEELVRQHWHNWLDIAVPALGDITPRKAAKSNVGREKLEALFSYFEEMNARDPGSHNNCDIDFLRRELRLDKR